jgi:monothiol glutaredoxin
MFRFGLARRFCDIQSKIAGLVKEHNVLLFMKGDPSEPRCGYSKYVVDCLKFYRVKDYSYINVLESDALREEVKKFSAWPTFPQLYVDGEFVGGCDIISEMHKEDTFKEVIDKYAEESEAEEAS